MGVQAVLLAAMASRPAESDSTPARRRRAPRVSGDERERSILETLEQLLETRPLADLSVDELARGAGISRSSFYFYFPSKEAVLLTLVQRVAAEADANLVAAMDGVADTSPARYRAAIGAFHETFRGHRSVALAAADAQASNPELRTLWSRVMDGWVGITAAIIDWDRERGTAPPGIPSRDLAVALNLMNENVLHSTFAQLEPTVSEEHVVDTLVAIWLGAIYGTAAPSAVAEPHTKESPTA